MKLTHACAALFFLLVSLPGCAFFQRGGGEIRLGVIAMLSGENAANGQSMADAVRLAVKNAGEDGAIRVGRKNRPVRVFIEDDGNSPEGAMNAARKLIYKDGVAAIIGPQFSINAIPVAKLAEREKILMICPLSTNPETTAGKRFVFRIPYLDTFQGKVIARFAREGLAARTAAVLYDVAGVYNRTLAEVFKKEFEDHGGKVVSFETYTTDQNTNFAPQLGRIAGAAPDVLFLPNYQQDVLSQARQAKEAGIRSVLMGGDGWDDSSLAVNPDFENSYLTRHWHPEAANAEARSFIGEYQEVYGRMPDDVAGLTYDAAGILFQAMKKAGKIDPESVQKKLYSLGPYRGISGTIQYTETGDPLKSAIVVRLKDKRSSVYGIVEP